MRFELVQVRTSLRQALHQYLVHDAASCHLQPGDVKEAEEPLFFATLNFTITYGYLQY